MTISMVLRRPFILPLAIAAVVAVTGCARSETTGDAAASVASTQAALDRDQAKADAARAATPEPTQAFVPDRRDRRPTDASR